MAHILNDTQHKMVQKRNAFLIRILDLVGAGVGLLLVSPIFLILTILIKVTSPGPIFYLAKRVGKDQRLFHLYKFRTMFVNADSQGPGVTVQDDPRITRMGRFLRRTKLDELPQLINILRGEMSLVGPRPEDARYVALYTDSQRQVLTVRPGLTSPASLYYRAEETMLSGDNWETTYVQQIMPHKLALDIAYLNQRTLWTDLLLILKTVTTIIGLDNIDVLFNLRNRYFFSLDILIVLCTPILLMSLYRTDLQIPFQDRIALSIFIGISLLIKMSIFYLFGLYRRYWVYAGVNDLTQVLIGVMLSTLLLIGLFGSEPYLSTYLGRGLSAYNLMTYHRSAIVLDGLFTFIAIGGLRLGFRGLYHWSRQRHKVRGGRRVLVVGAGEAGTMVVREMRANPQLNAHPIAFVDDDPIKMGMRIQGLPVLGRSKDIPRLVNECDIQQIVVAIPSAPLQKRRALTRMCEETGVPTETLPGIYELLGGKKTVSFVPKIDTRRLLGREPIVIDQTEVAANVRGAIVLVTGAGGSIGSELCRQLAQRAPKEIILLGHGENSIFEISMDLHMAFPHLITHQAIVDVRDRRRIDWVIEKYRPDLIFHAAAHKHVPFMEANIEEAITNNIRGTHNVLHAAETYGVKTFVLISTDKAVNPTSFMGATKRIAELLVMAAARRSGKNYLAVRFGNVLGSRGSVLPIFQRQISAGGPITLTHPDMRRYFMTIPEAVLLVLQASILGRGGEVFVLDMGEQVRIQDMAIELIKMAGFEPNHDIEIVYRGIRPGEKLSEELFMENESYRPTRNRKIFVAKQEDTIGEDRLYETVSTLIDLAERMQPQAVLERMQQLFPKLSILVPPVHNPLPPVPKTLTAEESTTEETFSKPMPA